MFLKLLLIAIVFLSIAFLGFATKILFRKNGQFPETGVGHNKHLRKKKIYCAKTEQLIIDKQLKKLDLDDNPACSTCL